MQSEYNVLPGTGLLYVVGAVRGAFGGGMLLDGAVVAYVSDCTSMESRSRIMGYLMVIISLATVIGSLLGGYVIELAGGDRAVVIKIGHIVGPFTLLYCAFILPESFHLKVVTTDDSGDSGVDGNSRRSRAAELDATTQTSVTMLGKVKESLKTVLAPLLLFEPGQLEEYEDSNMVRLPSRYSMLLLVCSQAILQTAIEGVDSLMIPYTNVEFNWLHREDALFIAFTSYTRFVVFVAVFPACQWLYNKYITESAYKKSGYRPLTTTYDEDENDSVDENENVDEGNSDESSGLLGVRTNDPTKDSDNQMTEDQDRSFEADYRFYLMGIALTAIGHLLVPIYRTEAVFYTGRALVILGSVAGVTFKSMVTSVVPAQCTSKIMGGVTVITTVCTAMGFVLYGWIFEKTAVTWPSFYFCIATFTCVIAFVIGILAYMWLPGRFASSPVLV
ncbi:hypothetical protein BGW41_003825 [Actinomortierella wolfii]|nr:hypothetical protein BGW41_003825 [Actinomortierella wolfii]